MAGSYRNKIWEIIIGFHDNLFYVGMVLLIKTIIIQNMILKEYIHYEKYMLLTAEFIVIRKL